MRYSIIQLTAYHVHRYSNVAPSDVGLWCYVVDGRAYGFKSTEEGARQSAEAGLGIN
jgi:hypothetical protein